MSGRRGSATIERLPSARGPYSIRPWNQPTTSPAAIRSATSANELVVVEPLRLEAGRCQRRRALVVRVLRPPVGVLHREPARPPELLVPDVERGADRDPRVAGRRLDEDLLERRLRAGCGRSRRRSARPRPRGRAAASSSAPRARARGAGSASSSTAWSDAATSSWSAVSSASGVARRPEHLLQLSARRAGRSEGVPSSQVMSTLPCGAGSSRGRARTGRRFGRTSRCSSSEEARRAVRREAHHLALVAVAREAEPLRDRGVEDPERVREEHALEHLERRAVALARASCSRRSRRSRRPRGRPRPRTADGKNALREVVLDVVSSRHLARVPQLALRRDPEAFAVARRARAWGARTCAEVQPGRDRIARDRAEAAPRARHQAAACAGKPATVLDPVEPLLLGGADELAVDDERGGGIAVVRVQSEDRRQAEILGPS